MCVIYCFLVSDLVNRKRVREENDEPISAPQSKRHRPYVGVDIFTFMLLVLETTLKQRYRKEIKAHTDDGLLE